MGLGAVLRRLEHTDEVALSVEEYERLVQRADEANQAERWRREYRTMTARFEDVRVAYQKQIKLQMDAAVKLATATETLNILNDYAAEKGVEALGAMVLDPANAWVFGLIGLRGELTGILNKYTRAQYGDTRCTCCFSIDGTHTSKCLFSNLRMAVCKDEAQWQNRQQEAYREEQIEQRLQQRDDNRAFEYGEIFRYLFSAEALRPPPPILINHRDYAVMQQALTGDGLPDLVPDDAGSSTDDGDTRDDE